mmetsp:Transcript_17304/g.29539  ORF Transcript_17304/g.29539 Transcript_17304/m.29539 type:complete len:130 (+) Transcript_17304:36-425(+)
MDGVLALQRWLVIVACLRVLSVVIGVFYPAKFKTTLIDRRPDLVTPLFGRLFAAWTTVTCILCLVCAYEPSNWATYTATLASFVVALVFFLSEVAIFKTVSVRCAMSPFIVAGVSTVWMLAEYKDVVKR